MDDAIAGETTVQLASGTDIVKAAARISGQFQTNSSSGYGLVNSITLDNVNQTLNASMYFEVTAVDTTNCTINVTAHSFQMDANGVTATVEQNYTLKLSNCNQSTDITVGGVTFDSAGFHLAAANHFSVGDKFGVEVTASQAIGKDKVIVQNDLGDTRE